MIRYIFVLTTAILSVSLAILIFILPTPDTTQITTSTASNEAATINNTNSFLIQDARVFTGQKFIDNMSIRVVDGIITELLPDIQPNQDETIIDTTGLTVLPALIDAHTHSYGDALDSAIRFGVSTHLDMFTDERDLLNTKAARQSLSNTSKTDLFSSGTLATVAGGHGTQFGFEIDTIDELAEVKLWIKDRINAGADYIKLVYMPYQSTFPSLDLAHASAIIDEAHAQGLQVYAHISSQQGASEMIEANIDGLVHIFADSVVTDELLELAVSKDIVIIPTLAVIASVEGQKQNLEIADNPLVKDLLSAQQKASLTSTFGVRIPGYQLDIAQQNVKRFFDAGVTILTGSDAPNSGTAFGVSTHHEMFLLVDAGLSPQDALATSTYLPASHFSLSGRGVIAPDARADLILVEGDLSNNIKDSLNISKVFKNGYLVNRQLNRNTSNKPSSALLGDFETPALISIDGFSWSTSSDSLANGNSIAEIAHDTSSQNTAFLAVKTTVKPGFPYPWAGAAVGDFVPPVEGIDISEYSEISFRVQGSPGKYRLMVFSSVAAGVPPTQSFEITEQWQTVTLSLSDFNGFDPTLFSGFAFVAGEQMGEFNFNLDDVVLQ